MEHNSVSKLIAIVFATVFSLEGNSAFAQATRKLSLDEAIKLSIQNSGQLKISNAKVDEAIASYHEAQLNYTPDLKASGSYLRLNSPDVKLKIKLGSSSSDAKPVKVDQAAYGIVNMTMPVFSGFRIKYGVESARYLEQAAKLDAEHDRDEVIQNTVNAYCNLYKAANSVAMVKENLEREEQRIRDFGNMEKNGLMARNDLLKAQLQKSNIELSLLDAENNYKITSFNMALMLGIKESTELMPDSSVFQKPVELGSIDKWEQMAQENRHDMSALSYREKAAVTGIKAAKGAYYPGLAITGGLIAADVPNVLTINNAMNIGVGLQYNFASIWKTKPKIDQANARLHELQATRGLLSDRVRLEVMQAYENYLLSYRKIDVYEKAVEQANENYRITKNKHDNSLVTTTDLLEADVAQLQAKLNYSFSKADALVAYKKLQQTAGIISKQ